MIASDACMLLPVVETVNNRTIYLSSMRVYPFKDVYTALNILSNQIDGHKGDKTRVGYSYRFKGGDNIYTGDGKSLPGFIRIQSGTILLDLL